MNDAQSTVVGLKAQDCPGGGWNGQPAEIERATVADCLAHGVCGCIYGGAVQHIERMQNALEDAEQTLDLFVNDCLSVQSGQHTLEHVQSVLGQSPDGSKT